MEESTQIGLLLGIVIGLIILTACGVIAFAMMLLGIVAV